MAEPPSQGSEQTVVGDLPPPGPLHEADGERRQITAQVERSPRALVAAIWRLAQREIESRLQSSQSDEDEQESAELAIRLAMIAASVKDAPREAERFLELAKEHPLAPRITLVKAVERGSADELRTAQMLVDALVSDKDDRAAAMRDLAEVWLYQFGNAERAARAAQAGLDSVQDTSSRTAAELREIFFLSLAVAGQWVDYVGFLGQAVATADIIPQHERLSMFIEALHASLDWLDRPENATKLVRRRFQLLGAAPDDPKVRAQYLHAVDLALLAATVASDRDRIDRRKLLRQRLELVEHAKDEAEVAVSRSWLAAELRQRRDWEGAAEQSRSLPEDGKWARRLRMLELARDGTLAGQWDEVVATLRRAADESGELSLAYLRRAAEISEAHTEGEEAADLWHQIVDLWPEDVQAQRRLERRLLCERSPSVCDLLDQRAERDQERAAVYWRRAAYFLGDSEGDGERVRLQLAKVTGNEPDRQTYWSWLLYAELVRAGGDNDRAVELFTQLGEAADKVLGKDGKRVGAALLALAGFAALSGGNRELATKTFEASLRCDSRDVLSQLALTALHRAEESYSELADSLDTLAAIANDEEIQVDALCELARVAVAHLGSPKRAAQALEVALDHSPDDPKVLRQMAQLSDHDSEWDKSVELRVRALEDAGSRESSSLLVEIGNIQEQRRQDDAEALSSYEQALEVDPESLEATRGMARLLRKKGEHGELLKLLRRELELVKDPKDVAGTHLDIARTLRNLDEPAELAINSYREVLKLEPETAMALD
ncbi:MAG: tetratricopeptide repeat protein, partial [Deltaproteobacteria bacterium]|nr:tetratricopeptide repeat protein [Deltaproteobacteria bacterium]